METVRDKQDIRDNLEAFDRELKGEPDASGFYHRLVKSGCNFVSYKVGDEWRFAPSRYIGYKDNSQEKHRKDRGNGSTTDTRLKLLLGELRPNKKKSRLFRNFAKGLGITSKKVEHKFFSTSFHVGQIDPMEIPDDAPIF